MSALPQQSRSQLLRSITELARGRRGDLPEWLLERYYRHVATEDLRARTPEALLGAVRSHRELAQSRPSGTACVRVFNPSSSKEGWTTAHTIIEVVTDDMPFLVDSVTAQLALEERLVHLLVHPQLVVRRDAEGELQEMLDVDPPANEPGADDESWMNLEIDRIADEATCTELADALERVLSDVRESVEDWTRMRDACQRVATELVSDPPSSVPEPIIERTRGLLDWLVDDHFTFLGYREYTLERKDGQDVLRAVPGTGLGLLRYDQPESDSFRRLTPAARASARDPQLLIITKANSRATVHRSSYLDYVGVKVFNDQGQVTGEKRFIGLFTSSAYTESVRRVPLIRERITRVLDRAGFIPDSHSGKDLLEVLENYPRDELFQTSTKQLYDIATDVLHLQERRKSAMFLRRDEYDRFVSCLIYIPRDRYSTAVRLKMEAVLREVFAASSVDFTTRISESVLARLHFVVRVEPGTQIPAVDEGELQRRLMDAARTWEEDLGEVARAEHGDEEGGALFGLYAKAFPEAYKEDFAPRQGIADLRHIEALESAGDTRFTLYRDPKGGPGERRFKLYRRQRVFLTDVLPVFTDLGVGVVDERPYEVDRADGATVYIYDFGLRASSEQVWSGNRAEGMRELFQDAFAAIWEGRAESDGFNALVLGGGLGWRQVVILRAVAKYLRQVGSTFSQDYLEEVLRSNPGLAAQLVMLFETRFDPDPDHGAGTSSEDRASAEGQVVDSIKAGLDAVSSLDHDRIIRSFLGVIRAMVRTSYYQQPAASYLSFKVDCHAVPGLPEPKPMFEIWVYSPRIEGVHLRFGMVARGGLRWSDRREDFRTEVLGLVKAQMVKNAVIVPTGSKGGFVAKQLPDPTQDRAAWLAEGVASYQLFISGMLDLTDNLVEGRVVPPERVVRHDGDDTYLVVAADKGTAKFSDTANAVAQSYGYWLDDAFASGGSAGYDHKDMGITARGAWESVKRHFRELDVDTQTQDFTAVGIGDMSGDVFGNGMLRSEHTALVAAFDHRDIFIDPTPTPDTAYAERQRLFDLPRSSWQDYDTALISSGGGVWSRALKSVPISPQVARALGLEDGVEAMTPAELMRAILLAPVDLLWNGGIGTYIKASTESNAQIGDRANDAIRVDGRDVRCKVVGEGGNLGCSQLGRIEAAAGGVQINTDAIDNSAGVDTSDHEVNIKILLTGLTRDGVLTLEQRDTLLHSMTDDVAELVLRDNYEQNVLLGNARAQAASLLPVHHRLIHWLEDRGELNRAIEFLPTDAEIKRRQSAGKGLTSPELAVLVAYSKLALKKDLGATGLPDEPWFHRTLTGYFPGPIQQRYDDQLVGHPLHREIIINAVVNSLVNRGGITFAFRAAEETGASSEQVTRAFVVAREVFGLASYVGAVEGLDNVASCQTQTTLYLEFRRLMDRATRWLLHNRPTTLDVGAEVERFRGLIERFGPEMSELLQGTERDRFAAKVAELEGLQVPTPLALRAAGLLDSFSLLDIVGAAAESNRPAEQVAPTYFAASEHFGIDTLLTKVSQLPRDDRWDALARGAMRDDLYSVLESLTGAVLAGSSVDATPQERLSQWCTVNEDSLARTRATLGGILAMENPGISALSVALRTLRGLIRSGAVSA